MDRSERDRKKKVVYLLVATLLMSRSNCLVVELY